MTLQWNSHDLNTLKLWNMKIVQVMGCGSYPGFTPFFSYPTDSDRNMFYLFKYVVTTTLKCFCIGTPKTLIFHLSKGNNLRNCLLCFLGNIFNRPGPGCSKLTTSLVNETLKFQMLISQICQYFLLKKCEKLLHCSLISSTKNINVFDYYVIKHLTT